MKQVVLLLTSRSDLSVMDNILQIMNDIGSSSDFYVLFNTEASIPEALQPLSERVHCFSSDILYTMGYMPIGDSLVPGSCHFAILNFFLAHPDYDYYWKIEDDVRFSGKWSTLLEHYSNDTSDMLSAYIKTPKEAPQWSWWTSLNTGGETVKEADVACAFNPVCRLSKRALQCVHESMLRGWRGHAEVVASTILRHNGLSIKDIGGTGSFVPAGEENLFYTKDTHSHLPLRVQDVRPDTVYHPVKENVSSRQLRKNCVISAAGQNSLHRHWLEGSGDRTFDLHLIVYDTSFSKFYGDADFMECRKGYKLKLVHDYLMRHPEYLNHYAYFFIPDDDIMTDAQSIDRLFSTMEQHALRIAQPALKQSYFTYPMTLQRHHSALRNTNFVEMMLPCFSNEALRKVIGTFNENKSGWGTEFHWPLLIETGGKDMGVIDSVPMIHTKPVQKGRKDNERELHAYLQKYGLTPNVKELDILTTAAGSEKVQAEMLRLHERRRTVLQGAEKGVSELMRRFFMGQISRTGLDGMLSLALILKMLAEATEAVQYDECADMVLSRVKGARKLEAAMDCSIDELLGMSASMVMERLSECQLRDKPSDNNMLFHSVWRQMHELHQIEAQMKAMEAQP